MHSQKFLISFVVTLITSFNGELCTESIRNDRYRCTLSNGETILMMESSLARSWQHMYHKIYWHYCSDFVNLRGVIERYLERQQNYSHFLLLVLDQNVVTQFQHFLKECYHSFHLFWTIRFSLFLYWDFIRQVIYLMTFSLSTVFIPRHGWKRYCKNLIKISSSVLIRWLSSWLVLSSNFTSENVYFNESIFKFWQSFKLFIQIFLF